MELPKPAVAGIIAVVLILVGTVGYMVLKSDSSTLSEAEEQQRQQATAESYKRAMQEGKGLPMFSKQDQMPAGGSTSGGSGMPSIYQNK